MTLAAETEEVEGGAAAPPAAILLCCLGWKRLPLLLLLPVLPLVLLLMLVLSAFGGLARRGEGPASVAPARNGILKWKAVSCDQTRPAHCMLQLHDTNIEGSLCAV